MWTSKTTPYVHGMCPIVHLMPYTSNQRLRRKRLETIKKQYIPFCMRTSSKGMAQVADNERRYRGLMNLTTSRASVWIGTTLKPISKHKDNYIVLATDYENYAITYQCTHNSVLYNKDIVTVLLRDPDLSLLQTGTMQKVKDEFDRLLGNGIDIPAEEETQLPKGNELNDEGKNVTEESPAPDAVGGVD